MRLVLAGAGWCWLVLAAKRRSDERLHSQAKGASWSRKL